MKKLPIGISSFEKIREEGYYYVDKTKYVKKLLDEGDYYFLSRPRRFGKSLFVDTIKCAFEGKKELFEGLYLYNKWNWEIVYPVIRIGFDTTFANKEDLEEYIREIQNKYAKKYGIKLTGKHVGTRMIQLIESIREKVSKKVVLLVDEYDKPIIDNVEIEKRKEAAEIREVLKSFYQTIKSLDQHLKFVFITGVSKFAKVSLFSGLNQLRDISLNKEYGDICGYTEEELIKVFGGLIKGEKELEEIREWYNGYWWLGSKIYNPFDVLLYLQNKEKESYWFETGNPEFLVKLIKETNYYIPSMEEVVLRREMLDWFDIEDIMIEALFFQTGYLTIKREDKKSDIKEIVLGYPNKEVKTALNLYISKSIEKQSYRWIKEIRDIFEVGNIQMIEELMNNVLMTIPYVWYKDTSKYESFYCSLFYVLMMASGLEVVAEDITNVGRIDMTVIQNNKVYIVEFKVDKDGALEQIKNKRYYQKYVRYQEIYLIGIVIDSKERKVKKIDIERYK